MTIGLGIIGLGAISKYYRTALGLDTGFTLAAACDADAATLAAMADPPPLTTPLSRALVSDPSVAAVVVNVPNDAHFDVCLEALEAGRHVCCEKPLALDPRQAAHLTAVARDRGLVLLTAFHRRYNRNVLRMVGEIGDREIAFVRVRYFEKIEEHAGADSWYLDPRRCGGGAIADNGPNALDLVRQLLGDVEIAGAEIHADMGGVDRRATIRARGAAGAPGAGAEALVELDWSYERGELKDVLVYTRDGREHSADMLAGFPAFKSSLHHEYVGVLRDFARRIAGEPADARRGPDGLAASRLVHEAYRLASASGAGAAR